MPANESQNLAIHAVLDAYEESIDALFECVALGSSASTLQKETSKLDSAVESLIAQDAALSQALDEVYQHRSNSVIIDDLQRQSRELDAELYKIMSAMQTAHRGLLRSAKETSQQVPMKHESVPFDVLIAYANRVAKHTPGLGKTFMETSKSSGAAFKTAAASPWPSEDLMRRGILATGSINMLKPSEKKRRWQQNTANSSRTHSIQTEPPQQNGEVKKERDPTTRPAAYEEGNGQINQAAPAASSAAALDLDLFDPDEED